MDTKGHEWKPVGLGTCASVVQTSVRRGRGNHGWTRINTDSKCTELIVVIGIIQDCDSCKFVSIGGSKRFEFSH